jgi:hypothetical protein
VIKKLFRLMGIKDRKVEYKIKINPRASKQNAENPGK